MENDNRSKAGQLLADVLLNADKNLLEYYGVDIELPLGTQIRHLMLKHKLDARAICAVYNIDPDSSQGESIETFTTKVINEWRSKGKAKPPEEKEVEIGRYIADLEHNKAELERQYANGRDPKVLVAITNLTEKIAKISGVEKNTDAPDDMSQNEKLEAKLASLNTEDINKLHKFLQD